MSVHIIPGQDDVSLEVGAGGDKTVTVTVSGTHVKVLNEDPQQGVMYTLVAVPTFPGDWEKLDPGEEVMDPTGGSTTLHLRKKSFIRGVYATNDVPVRVQVGETDQAI